MTLRPKLTVFSTTCLQNCNIFGIRKTLICSLSGKLSSESTSQILYVLEGGVTEGGAEKKVLIRVDFLKKQKI